MYLDILIVFILIAIVILYISTNPGKLNNYQQQAETRHYWESKGYFYDWAPNLTVNQLPDFRADVISPSPTPSISPPPTPSISPPKTPPPKKTLPPKTLPPTPKPGEIPVTKDCDAFIKAIGGYDGIVGCRNVLHAKCKDNKPNYKPANAAEQKCADYLAKFTGNICNCMASIHKVCMQSGKRH
jgi:hypothetical protein